MRRRPRTSCYRPHYGDAFFRRLLQSGPFQRRPRGGWRFGAKLISEAVVWRLVENSHATICGDLVVANSTVRG